MPAPAIACEDVWKIFGDHAGQALEAARDGNLDKGELFKRYGAVLAVAGATFSVTDGEIFCIMGLSGSGKSTLIRHVNRLIDPTAGRILINGEDIRAKTGPELRRLRAEKIGMVFQHMALFPHRSVLDNVAYGLEIRGIARKERHAKARETLALVQLNGWERRKPQELSGGMQQRVGLARALAVDPAILLMDEPFSALDPLIRRQLQDQFLELAQTVKKTTIFITHDLDEAMRLGDRVAIMKDGRLNQIGTPQEIATRPADAYVAEFVKDISRMRILYAGNVADPDGCVPQGAPRVDSGAGLAEVIDHLLASERPVAVVDDAGRIVGAIAMRDVLAALRDAPTHPVTSLAADRVAG